MDLHASRAARVFYGFARGIGAGLVGFAVMGIMFAYGPIIKEEATYLLSSGDVGRNYELEAESNLKLAEAQKTLAVQAEAENWGVDSYFSLVIPKINASSSVIANVDASDEAAYVEALKQGVAHAAGTYFPGQGDTVFLFAHSTDSPVNIARYNAVFYLLRKLEPGDEITVFFADKKYKYRVTEKVNTSADDVSWLEAGNSEGERLILQTCDPPGTTWRRLLIIAEPV